MKKQTIPKEESKIKEIEKKLTEAQKQVEEYKNDLIRLQADFENYIKRANKEKENLVKLSNENLIKELLIILDDFEIALHQVENEKNKEGLILLHKKFFKILESQGLKRIEALGKKFDPYHHEVIKYLDSNKEENEVLEETQKGYIFHDSLLRPSKVIISNGKMNKITTNNQEGIQNV